MTPQENSTYSRDALCDELVYRHSILATELVKRELPAIYWTLRAKSEIDADLGNHTEELEHGDSLWGLLRSMLDRTFEYTEGAIAAFVTGATASSEVISRTAIESAINLLFILVDERKGNRLPYYLAYYVDHEQKEIDQWLKATSSLAGEAQRVHQLAATEKRERISKLQEATDFSLLLVSFSFGDDTKAGMLILSQVGAVVAGLMTGLGWQKHRQRAESVSTDEQDQG